MADDDLSLADVKRRFIESEGALRSLAETTAAIGTSRDALDRVREALGEASSQLANRAEGLAELTGRLDRAASAVETAEPGAIREAVAEVDQKLDNQSELVGSLRSEVQSLRTILVGLGIAQAVVVVLAVLVLVK